MQLFIPSIGTKLRLLEPWTFTLHNEYRNTAIMEAVTEPEIQIQSVTLSRSQFETSWYQKRYRNLAKDDPDPLGKGIELLKGTYERATFPKETLVVMTPGTVLSIDRIYIKRGLPSFDSITFRIVSTPDVRFKTKKHGGFFKGQARFWAKLADINTMEVEIQACN